MRQEVVSVLLVVVVVSCSYNGSINNLSTSILPSWSRSVWWSEFSHHASHLLHCDYAIPALSAGALGTSFCAPSYNTAIFPPFCGAPSVGVPSPGCGTRVPFYLVGDVVAY